jgi:hypothetical protein
MYGCTTNTTPGSKRAFRNFMVSGVGVCKGEESLFPLYVNLQPHWKDNKDSHSCLHVFARAVGLTAGIDLRGSASRAVEMAFVLRV